jgi:TonB family protein
VTGQWPLPERWEGQAIVEEHAWLGAGGGAGPIGPTSVWLRTPSAVVQLASATSQAAGERAASAVTIGFRGSGGGVDTGSFDEVEQRQVAQATRNAASQRGGGPIRLESGVVNRSLPPGSASLAFGVGTSTSPGTAPVRVGGAITQPRKVVDVAAVPPVGPGGEIFHGVAILEITSGVDGAVTDAKVLRSLHRDLDDAALQAVKRWRYEPTLLNGTPVPVIMTVTVRFP